MTRFLAVLLLFFTSITAHAQMSQVSGALELAKSSPPLTGDMGNLMVLEKPVALPSVMLSSRDKGLTYLSEYKTKLVLLNIWATWCPPCIEELPSLNALQHAMGGNLFSVVSVSLDTTGPEAVKKYLTDNHLDMLQGYIDINQDIQKLEVLKGMPGVPITLIIDPQMRVVALYEGAADWNGPAARAVLEYYAKHVSYSPI